MLGRPPRDALAVGKVALPVYRGAGSDRRRSAQGTRGHQGDAVHGARRNAKLAARAQLGDDGMHVALRSDDRIDRTWRQALGAADAPSLVDPRNVMWHLEAAAGIERQRLASEQSSERLDGGRSTRRTPVDWRFPACDRLGVGTTGGISAPCALRLRQQSVDAFGGSEHEPWPPVS
ncbi:MAG TPA: hypothetical protein VMU40_00080 [Steroidobacteraceae bacterium]|nr:hypothetical protein [Steroidobacteraceae bacterium]